MPESQKKINILGIICTIIATVGFLFAGLALHNLFKPAAISEKEIEKNLENTFANLKKIAQAQEEYKKADWDNDGNYVYAKFYIHLWTSVSKTSDPIKVGLISKKLAFAIEAGRAVNGYYFIDLHDIKAADGQRPIDYNKQWAILASAPNESLNEVIYLLADTNGIYTKRSKYVSPEYIENPIADGWTKIDSAEELRRL